MSEDKNGVKRNRPSEAGHDNDNRLRDDSGLQPGISTISSSESDDANQELTRTAGDDFRTENFEEGGADRTFDEPSQQEDK